MQQSASQPSPSGLHVGIIMDGNGRWATAQGRSRSTGHREGAKAVQRVVEAAPVHGISVLTLFAFSADNWRRPPTEVTWLMRLFGEYLRSETSRCVANGVRLEIIGRRDRIGARLRQAIDVAETETAKGTRLHLRIALDYSARDAILRAARDLGHPLLALGVRAHQERPLDVAPDPCRDLGRGMRDRRALAIRRDDPHLTKLPESFRKGRQTG